jgi:hypothetical protein
LKISKDNLTKLFLLTLFGAGFGYVEAAVVVYLRAFSYPSGFDIPEVLVFPFIRFGNLPFLQPVPFKILLTEIGRETATILTLASVAWLAAKAFRQKLAFFLWAFAAWDIFYYIFLKIIIGWPKTLGVLDVLFLIPVPWIAPVWFPVAASLLMMTTCLLLLSEKIK